MIGMAFPGQWSSVFEIVFHIYHLILLVSLSAGTMDGKNAYIVGSEAPNSKCAAEGSNAGVCAFRTLHKHAIGGEDFFLLAICLGLKVSDATRKEIGIHKFALASAEIQFLFQLPLLESKPVSDLLPAEGDLTGTVANIKDRRSMFGLDFTCDGKRTATRGRNGTASFITTK